MRKIRLFESGGEMSEKKILDMLIYLIKADALDPKTLDFVEQQGEHDIVLITPFGRVGFEANSDSQDHEYQGEGYWSGVEEFWRRLEGVDYYLLTNSSYHGKEHDELEYLESMSIASLDSKSAES